MYHRWLLVSNLVLAGAMVASREVPPVLGDSNIERMDMVFRYLYCVAVPIDVVRLCRETWTLSLRTLTATGTNYLFG